MITHDKATITARPPQITTATPTRSLRCAKDATPAINTSTIGKPTIAAITKMGATNNRNTFASGYQVTTHQTINNPNPITPAIQQQPQKAAFNQVSLVPGRIAPLYRTFRSIP